MIDIAGKDIIFETTEDDWTPFHIASYCGASIGVIKLFIDIGGKELLMQESHDGWNALGIELWKLCENETWDEVRSYLNSNEPREVKKANVEWENRDDISCLHMARNKNAPVDIIQSMIDIAGSDTS
jgi:ankyrin repeat protein